MTRVLKSMIFFWVARVAFIMVELFDKYKYYCFWKVSVQRRKYQSSFLPPSVELIAFTKEASWSLCE